MTDHPTDLPLIEQMRMALVATRDALKTKYEDGIWDSPSVWEQMSAAIKQADAALSAYDLLSTDICGLCGEPGADKFAQPAHWPGERIPDSELVHRECEEEECKRAHSLLTTRQRVEFLRTL